MEFLGYLFAGICMIPIFRMRKGITFFFCPDEIISSYRKSYYFALYSFFPSIIAAGFSVSQLRIWITKIEFIKEYENIALLIGLGLLFILLALTGRLAEEIVYITNSEFSEWKDNRELKNRKSK